MSYDLHANPLLFPQYEGFLLSKFQNRKKQRPHRGLCFLSTKYVNLRRGSLLRLISFHVLDLLADLLGKTL